MSSQPELTTISPINLKPIIKRPEFTVDQIPAAVKASKDAFVKYKETDLASRQAIVGKALDILESKADDLAKELTEQMGRPVQYCAVEVKTAVKRARYMLKISDEALKNVEGEAEAGFKRYIKKVPIGTVLVIFAWNVSIDALYLLFDAKFSSSSIHTSYWSIL